jgi:putative restriction endonuclease
LEEINFWRPSGSSASFRAIAPGELFFFRLKSPISRIAGFGRFVHYSLAPLELAWRAFGRGNGCDSRAELIHLITRYRKQSGEKLTPLMWPIGCVILSDVNFYPKSQWLPYSFPPGLVQGKSIDVQSEDGQLIWQHMRTVIADYRARDLGKPGSVVEHPFALVSEERATYHTGLIKERVGQGAFRVMVLDAYGR